MKKYFYTLLFCSICTFVFPQKYMDKNFQITRVQLKEKINLSARSLPRLLIRAFCEGNISGYYPYKPEMICSYHEFAAHFNVVKTQPVAEGDAFEEVPCPASFCMNKDEASVEPFCFYYDIIEDKGFDSQKSSTQHKIKYIRLIYAFEKHGMEIIYTGPVFLYEDVIKLNAGEYSLFNPKNDAARISLKQYFEGRMFSGNLLKINPQPSNPVNPNREKDKWDH